MYPLPERRVREPQHEVFDENKKEIEENEKQQPNIKIRVQNTFKDDRRRGKELQRLIEKSKKLDKKLEELRKNNMFSHE